MRIRTNDVVGQLRLSYAAEAKALAGNNVLLSRAEATKVASDDLRGAITALIDGQPGVRLNVDMVVDEAIKRALQRLKSVNVAGTQYVSKAEVDAIPASRFEYHLRTAAATASGLKRITDPDESPVGFDPATDAFQFQLARVWGDNSVFVTLAKDGTGRLEDFN